MKKLLLLFVFSTQFAGCAEDDGNQAVIASSFEGTWAMTHYSDYTPEPVTIAEGDIIWDFNTQAQTISMHNEADGYLSHRGTFKYTMEGNTIIVEYDHYDTKYFYTFDGEGLKLQSGTAIADGPTLRFKRI